MAELRIVGRPSDYTDSLGREICRRLEEGDGLWKICLPDDMPSRGTVLRWARDNEEFRNMYARAMLTHADASVDDIDRIARDGGRDILVEYIDGIKVERVDHENIQRSKLIVDAIKWKSAKLSPAKYGDRIAHQMLDEKGKPTKPRVLVIVDGAPGSTSEDDGSAV